MLLDNGCWADFRAADAVVAGRPLLFLDRDGVIVEETHYLHRRQDVRLIAQAGDVIGRARAAGWLCGVVTNQAGIGRGLYGWDEFHAVQDEIEQRLAQSGAQLDFVVACPHHPEAVRPQMRHSCHPWRKPEPGMLLAVMDHFAPATGRSMMVGDTLSDLRAGAAAGTWDFAHVATGHGARERNEVRHWAGNARPTMLLTSIAELLNFPWQRDIIEA